MSKTKDYQATVKFGKREKSIFGILIAAIVVLFAISSVSYFKTYKAVKYRAKSSLSDQTEKCASDVERIFELKFMMLKYLVSLPEINTMDMNTQKNYLQDKVDDLGFESMFIMYSNGQGYYVNEDKVREQGTEPFFKSVMANETFITAPFYQQTEGRSITTLCQSIYLNGQKVGSLCGVVSLTDLDEIVQSVRSDMEATVVNSDGTYVVNKDMSLVNAQKTYKDVYKNDKDMLKIYEKAIKSGKSGKASFNETKVDGTDYYVATERISSTDWTVVLTMKRSDAVQGLDTLIIIQFVSIAALLVLIIAISVGIVKMLKREKETFSDSLTGINNRARTIVELGSVDIDKEEDIMVVSIDLNDFRKINDEFGRKTGDNAIKDLAKVLVNTFGKNGFVGRMAGDEFVAILRGNVEIQFDTAIKGMTSEIDKLNARSDVKYKLSTSYGYSVKRASDNKTGNDLFKEADQKKYIYKDTYKNGLR